MLSAFEGLLGLKSFISWFDVSREDAPRWLASVSVYTSFCDRDFQVPTPLPPNRRRFLAIKWLITAAREQQKTNKNARMYKKLAKELLEAYNNEVTILFFLSPRHLHKTDVNVAVMSTLTRDVC